MKWAGLPHVACKRKPLNHCRNPQQQRNHKHSFPEMCTNALVSQAEHIVDLKLTENYNYFSAHGRVTQVCDITNVDEPVGLLGVILLTLV